MEFAFVSAEVQSDFSELLEYTAKVVPVFSQGVTADEDVINVGHDEFVKERSENIVNEVLEEGRRIGESE
jgi:hypothetical protein